MSILDFLTRWFSLRPGPLTDDTLPTAGESYAVSLAELDRAMKKAFPHLTGEARCWDRATTNGDAGAPVWDSIAHLAPEGVGA